MVGLYLVQIVDRYIFMLIYKSNVSLSTKFKTKNSLSSFCIKVLLFFMLSEQTRSLNSKYLQISFSGYLVYLIEVYTINNLEISIYLLFCTNLKYTRSCFTYSRAYIQFFVLFQVHHSRFFRKGYFKASFRLFQFYSDFN